MPIGRLAPAAAFESLRSAVRTHEAEDAPENRAGEASSLGGGKHNNNSYQHGEHIDGPGVFLYSVRQEISFRDRRNCTFSEQSAPASGKQKRWAVS